MSRVFDPGVIWAVARIPVSAQVLDEARDLEQEWRDYYRYGPILGPGRWEHAYVLRGRRALESLKGRPAGPVRRHL